MSDFAAGVGLGAFLTALATVPGWVVLVLSRLWWQGRFAAAGEIIEDLAAERDFWAGRANGEQPGEDDGDDYRGG